MVSVTKDIRKFLQYQITAKARGYYDKSITATFTEDNPSLDLGELTPYDGLKYTVDLSKNSVRPGEINFDETILPYDNTQKKSLLTTNYCFGTIEQNYDLPIYKKIYNNITKVGNVSVNNGIASNFSASDYLDLGNLDFSGDYEIVLKFKMPETDSDISNYKPFFDAKSNYYFNIALTNYRDGKRYIHTNSGNGSSWYTDFVGTTPLELNTEYYVKVVRSGTTRTTYLSTDNITWSTEGNVEDTYNYSLGYGLGAVSYLSSAEIFKGSFDLNESKIIIGENIINLGEYTLQKQYTGYVIEGNAKVNSLICSGFDSLSKVILSNTRFNKSENIFIIFTTGSDISSNQCLYSTKSGPLFVVNKGYIHYLNRGTGKYIQWHQVQANTGYRIKIVINSSDNYSLGWALKDEHTYDYTYVTDSGLNFTDSTTHIGNWWDATSGPFYGTVDITNIPGAYEVKTESKPGIFDLDFTDTGTAKILNCFSNSNESVVLSEKENYNNYTWLGTVNIPKHNVF